MPESNTLVSPEILARGGAGETRRVHRCFDPPSGWRFDKQRRGVVVVERLGWLDDVGDPTLNSGTVEFAPDEGARQICVVVTAKPVTKAARTATIGRFEATRCANVWKTRRRAKRHSCARLARGGARADRARAAEWKLYVRLFDESRRELSGTADGGPLPVGVPFLHVSRDADGKTMMLQADPAAEP